VFRVFCGQRFFTMKQALRLSIGLVCVAVSAFAAEPLYQQNFEAADAGSVPDGLLVIDGNFTVKAEDGKKALELPGSPLDTFGTLFGPSRPDNTEVTARIFATKKGRKFPAFAVSLNGVGGYRLKVAPAKGAVEIVKADAIQKSVPFDWKSGEWTSLKLRGVKAGDGFKIEGKVWQGDTEPKDWTLTMDVATPPPPGKAGVWGMPFSGTPIRFDDLVVREAE
jgi:hypothetical protein